jgi:hypothetical protein
MSEGTKMIVGGLAVLVAIIFCSWLLTVLGGWPPVWAWWPPGWAWFLWLVAWPPGWAWFLWLVIIGAPVTVGAFMIWDGIRNR